jgi:hypothetical protein
MRVLTITASYDDGGKLIVDPGFVVDGEPTPDARDGEPALDVEVLDRRGNTVHAARVPWTRVCAPPADGAAGGSPTMAVGLVRFERAAAGLRLRDRGRLVLERTAPRGRLAAEVVWPAPVTAGDDRKRRIEWHSASGAMAAPAYSADGGATWLPLGLPSPESPIEVDFTNVPGSRKGQLRLLVTDGLRTITVDSEPWALAPTGWVGAILTPGDGATVPADEPVYLAGQAIDVESHQQADAKLEWYAEGIGRLGTGPSIDATFPAGSHTVELRLGDATLASVAIVAAGR